MKNKKTIGLIILTIILIIAATAYIIFHKPTPPQPKQTNEFCAQYNGSNCPAGCKIKLLGGLDYSSGTEVEYFSEKCVSAD
jgi:hypothetical protein